MGVQITATVDFGDFDDFETSLQLRDTMMEFGDQVTPRAIAKTGLKSGDLRRSMGHDVVQLNGAWILVFGSGVAPGTENMHYDVHHWAPGKPGGWRASWPGTRPWTRTLREIGIEFENREFDV